MRQRIANGHELSMGLAIAATCVTAAPLMALELPSKITPAVRAACETDVRRMCVKADSTVASVKACVIRRYESLNGGCKVQLAKAGLWPPSSPAAAASSKARKARKHTARIAKAGTSAKTATRAVATKPKKAALSAETLLRLDD